MFCRKWDTLRQRMLNEAGTTDYHFLIGTGKGLKTATKMLMDTGLLGQFSLAKTLLYGDV